MATATITQQRKASGQSTDYSADKSVNILQEATVGKGISIVIMGDGFIDKEIADGTYNKVMEKHWKICLPKNLLNRFETISMYMP